MVLLIFHPLVIVPVRDNRLSVSMVRGVALLPRLWRHPWVGTFRSRRACRYLLIWFNFGIKWSHLFYFSTITIIPEMLKCGESNTFVYFMPRCKDKVRTLNVNKNKQKCCVGRAREVSAFILNGMKPDFRRLTLTWLVPRFTGSKEMCYRERKLLNERTSFKQPALIYLPSTDCFRWDALPTATFPCHQERSGKVVSFPQISAVFDLAFHREYWSVATESAFGLCLKRRNHGKIHIPELN